MKMMNKHIICIGVSSGGLDALTTLFSLLQQPLSAPILIVQHIGDDSGNYLSRHLNTLSATKVITAMDKMPLRPKHAYIAPGGYHMLIEDDMHISLSVDDRVCYCRPSIDVLLQSAALLSQTQCTAIILTGANSDGSDGVVKIKAHGGTTIAQKPMEAEAPLMPEAAIDTGAIDYILSLEQIAQYLTEHFSTATSD